MALVLVTGASTGLGLATATSLADDGHEVVIHLRNRSRLEDPSLLDKVRGVVTGDLADREATISIAEQANHFGRFDAVIHNAGVINSDDVFTVNIVAPYLLTALMERPQRSIFLSSSMHMGGSAELDSLDFARADRDTNSYSDSKLLLTAFTMVLPSIYSGILSHAVCPGWVPTRMGGPHASDDFTEGHRTQEWLAIAPESDITPRTGGYWHHRRSISPHPATLDTGFQEELVSRLTEYTGIRLDG